ncbi:hypothetical protein chiPu_0024458, partial [Chiloscyllium punctatum]|nr:hypothetical protein [Chiloscyllium punctatum]
MMGNFPPAAPVTPKVDTWPEAVPASRQAVIAIQFAECHQKAAADSGNLLTVLSPHGF